MRSQEAKNYIDLAKKVRNTDPYIAFQSLVTLAAVNKFDKKDQLIVAIEELSELQKELCKHLRGRDNINAISEEMADVGIMLDQLILIFSNYEQVQEQRLSKCDRLLNRLEVQ